MKNPSQYHIQKRKDGRYAVTVMFKGKRQTIYGKTKKETLEKLTRTINEIQYAKIHNLQNYSATTTTLSAWATECVETYSKDYVRGNTYYAYKNIIKRQWKDIDFEKGCISITKQLTRHHSKYDPAHLSVLDIAPPKTESSIRKVYMIDALKSELLAYKEKVIDLRKNTASSTARKTSSLRAARTLLSNPVGFISTTRNC